MAPVEKAAERPTSASKVRLAPLKKLPVVREVREDAAEQVLLATHEQPAGALASLVALANERRACINLQVAARNESRLNREGLRVAVREELGRLHHGMQVWMRSKKVWANDWSVFSWLVTLPDTLAKNSGCKGSLKISPWDIDWLVIKAQATLAVLCDNETDQRAHAVRRGVSAEELPGFMERIGCLREGFVPSPPNDWLGAFAAARVGARDVVDFLLALFLYTADCRSRVEVDGWELSDDDEWTTAAPPKRADVHGPNSSPWAVMNWTLRTAHDHTQTAEVRKLAGESLVAFSVLRDRIDEALSILPKERDVVFRGVHIPGLSYRYNVGHAVVFPPFTSTSTQGEEARRYAKDEGTFFIVRSHSAARIDFVSFMPAEAEKLLPSFSHFEVLRKESTTILRMLECRHDIVTLAEYGDSACTDAEAVDAYLRSAKQTRFVHASYVADTYVEGQVAPLPPPCDETTPLFEYVDAWLEGAGHMLLLGTGGSGKTSATLAAHARLASRDDVAPVFVPLPTVKNLFSPGALDAHIAHLLRLSPSQLTLLADQRTVVLMLESLDEAHVSPGADVRRGVSNLLAHNPFAARSRVLLSCRSEFLRTHGIQPFDVFGVSGQCVYVQPFSVEEVDTFVRRQCARLGQTPEAASEKLLALSILGQGMRGAMSNPCVLHMACRIGDARIREIVTARTGRIPPATVYEAFVSQSMCGDEAALLALQRAAIAMLSANNWHVTVGAVRDAFETAGIDHGKFRSVHLPRIPRRVENDGDDGSAFAWWHKSIGEYLAARAFWRLPSESLAAVARPFSLDTPAVMAFFADIADENPALRKTVCEKDLVPTVVGSRGTPSPRALAAASNALALMCASSQLLHSYDLSDIVIESANLVGARLVHAQLQKALFRKCQLNRVSFDFADVRGASFPHSVCERVLPPLLGHGASVASVCFSRDGKILASGSDDKTVRLWNATTGNEMRVLSGHTDDVFSVSFSPDGTLLASGAWDKTIRLWRTSTWEEVSTISVFASVSCISFSPDGKTIAAAVQDSTLRLMDVASGKELRLMEGHTKSLSHVCYSPDGTLLASASADETVRLWDAVSGTVVKVLEGHLGEVTCVCFSPDGTQLASGANNNTVFLWDVETGAEMQSFYGHFDPVTSVAFSPDGKVLASGSFDGTVRLWDVITGSDVRVLAGNSFTVRSVCFSPDGRLLATGADDMTVQVYHVTADADLNLSEGHSTTVSSVCFAPDGRLLSASHDATARLWDPSTGMEVGVLEGHAAPVMCARVSPHGSTIATCSHDATVRLWDMATSAELRVLEGHTGDVACVCFSPDGRTLASASWDASLRVWDVATGKQTRSIDGNGVGLTAVAFSPDGGFLVSGGRDSAVRMWDAKSGYPLRVMSGHEDAISSVCFSPNGTRLASASSDHSVRLWDPATGLCERTLEGHEKPVMTVCFSPNGNLVASGSVDETVRVWDAKSGALLRVLRCHSATVTGVSFSLDGARLASCSYDKLICLWDASMLTEAPPATEEGVESNDTSASALLMLIGRPTHISAANVKGPVALCEGASPGLYSCFGTCV